MKQRLIEILDFINHPVIAFALALLLAFAIWGGDTAETTKPAGNIQNETETLGLKSLGTFTITAYCPCAKCCGKDDGITATGVKATAGRTIAVDPNVIPYGTELFIDGFTYRAEDTGGSIKGRKLDIFFANHLEALEWGVREYEVFIYE
jgi:3D (Asp-Asp-Asp) domain-containing protein